MVPPPMPRPTDPRVSNPGPSAWQGYIVPLALAFLALHEIAKVVPAWSRFWNPGSVAELMSSVLSVAIVSLGGTSIIMVVRDAMLGRRGADHEPGRAEGVFWTPPRAMLFVFLSLWFSGVTFLILEHRTAMICVATTAIIAGGACRVHQWYRLRDVARRFTVLEADIHQSRGLIEQIRQRTSRPTHAG